MIEGLQIHRIASALFPVWLGVALAVGGAAEAIADTAPLAIRDQHPLALLHLSAVPQSAAPIDMGSTLFSSSLSLSNTLNRERGDFLIDAETRVFEVTARHTIVEGLELSATASAMYRGGGGTDHLIEEWHSIFGLPNGQRRRVPQDSFAIEGTNRDGSKFSFTRDGVAMGDLALGAKQLLYVSSDRSQLVSATVRAALPTGAESYGQDAIDVGSDLLGSWSITDSLAAHLGTSYIFFGDVEEEGLRYQRHHYSSFFTLGYQLTPSLSVLAQGVISSALLKDLPRYPDFSTYLDVALRYSRSGGGSASLALRENPYPDKSTTDVTLFAEVNFPLFLP